MVLEKLVNNLGENILFKIKQNLDGLFWSVKWQLKQPKSLAENIFEI